MNEESLVIFDCDGVLVDSEPIANAIFAEHLTDLGLPTTLEQAMERYKGRSMASCLDMVAQALGKPVPGTFLDDLQAETYKAFERDLQPIDGAEDLVTWVQAKGYKTCIASSGDYEKLGITLGITGLGRFFEGRIFSAKDVTNGKPAPDLFLHACNQVSGVPGRSYVIEDSPAGVTAARAAGMQVFAFGTFDEEPGTVPVKVLSDIKKHL